MRGEYGIWRMRSSILKELPPRARRILTRANINTGISGTTSACAENTSPANPNPPGIWNYLRVRGEYHRGCAPVVRIAELPPRARRIQGAGGTTPCAAGTTSACAENTGQAPWLPSITRNYLRVRGEYGKPISRGEVSMELPPRARRILATPTTLRMVGGTTSACAENTAHRVPNVNELGNYLRVRGEYFPPGLAQSCSRELPPRARRIP